MNIKTIILGASGVGKTRLLNHLRKTSVQTYCPTVGVDFTVYRGPKEVALQIWDTSGSKRFKSVVETFLRGIDLCIFVYKDIESFETMMTIISDVKRDGHGKRFCIIALDAVELGKSVADKYGFFFFHVNVEIKESCIYALDNICCLCYEEQMRTNFLKLKMTNNFSVERRRESGYCWWSFC